ncbi:hypothetical protein N7509_000796 [Penicillium cosmopolitanum]|uniref:BTB domain-containing protein n=1 Tax=Penicillium cosmopolitanum TaxID=1131564 RepID=A0A9X0BEJ9_9EURO|nr:uncharacterized protein N7509_000796 [Penicillium cosmopolitanum]KAJ5414169.1 hypothetical protein N7509_000796 [Penicillium cosmopolitanum]
MKEEEAMGEFIENILKLINIKEASSGRYTFSDEPEIAIEALVSYLYTRDYDTKVDSDKMQTAESLSDFKLYAHMFAIAEKYKVQGLADLSAKNYQACLDLITDCPEFIRFKILYQMSMI